MNLCASAPLRETNYSATLTMDSRLRWDTNNHRHSGEGRNPDATPPPPLRGGPPPPYGEELTLCRHPPLSSPRRRGSSQTIPTPNPSPEGEGELRCTLCAPAQTGGGSLCSGVCRILNRQGNAPTTGSLLPQGYTPYPLPRAFCQRPLDPCFRRDTTHRHSGDGRNPVRNPPPS